MELEFLSGLYAGQTQLFSSLFSDSVATQSKKPYFKEKTKGFDKAK